MRLEYGMIGLAAPQAWRPWLGRADVGDARVWSTRLGSAGGEEGFDHGPTLAYRDRVGQAAVQGTAVGCDDVLP